MIVFFFDKEPVWKKYRQELGIDRAVNYLKGKGLPATWPEEVPDPKAWGTLFLPKGKPHNRSDGPNYQGYYLCGGCGGVSCKAAGEILPGITWDTVCRDNYQKCPFYKEEMHG